MKKFLVVMPALFLFLFSSQEAQAKASGGGTHFKENPPYDCSVTKKPGAIRWIVLAKKDKINDKKLVLTWDDSSRAHDVEIKYNNKTKKTGDDSRENLKNLKNGKPYTVKIRGYSNCGKGSWSKKYIFIP